MCRKYQAFLVLFTLMCLNICIFSNVCAQVSFNIEVEPDTRTIHIKDPTKRVIEPKEIAMIAQTDKTELVWSLDGPGKLEGNPKNPGIVYVAPEMINGRSEQATITVTVTHDGGKTSSNKVIFTITIPDGITLPQLTPLPAPPPPPPTGYIQVVVNVPDVKVYINNKFVGTAQPIQPLNYAGVPVDKKALVKVEFGESSEFKVVPVYPGQWSQVIFRLPDPMLDQLLEEAENYLEKQWFTEPEGKNAFDLCKAVLEIDPMNLRVLKIMREMLTMSKNWADNDYRSQEYSKAKRYYQQYLNIAQYYLTVRRDENIEQEYYEVQRRLQGM